LTNKELFYFIGKCLSLDDAPATRKIIIDQISGQAIDWERFVRLCSNQLILQVIYIKFQSHDLLKYLPDDLVEHLENIYQLNCTRNVQILKQIEEITIELNKVDVYPVFLKGTGNLLDGVYSDVGERIIGDIDLLVPEKDYLTSAKIIEGIGYTKDEWPVYLDILSIKHYPRLWKKDVPADVEIHRLPVIDKYLHWLNSDMIFSDYKPVPGYSGAFVPSDEHKVIHNFIHSQLTNSGHYLGIVSFRDLYDLYLYSKRTEVSVVLKNQHLRQKALDYYLLGGKILGLQGIFYAKGNISSSLFILRHNLKLTYSFYNRTDYITRKIIKMIFESYIIKLYKCVYVKSMRRQVIGKLKDTKWYSTHFKRYIDLFN
jgi:hypothetical protein